MALVCASVLFSCKPEPVVDEPEDTPEEPKPSTGIPLIKADGRFQDWNNVNIVSSTDAAEGLGAIDKFMAHMDDKNVFVYLHCTDKSSLDNVRICIDNDADETTGSELPGVIPGKGYCGMINVASLLKPGASVFYRNLAKGDKEIGLANFITGGYAYDEGTKNALQLELAIDRDIFEEFHPIGPQGVRIAVYAINAQDEVSACIPSGAPLQIAYIEHRLPPAPEVYYETFEAPEPPFEYDVTYEYDPTDFANPERGPYSGRYVEFKDGKMPDLNSPENLGASLKDGCSLILFSFYLKDFLYSDISEEALATIRKQFEYLRESGCKTVFRFAYTYNEQDAVKDPEVDQALRHVEQVAPIIQDFTDVIMVWQAGFIGPWGEMHSSTHFLTDADVNRLLRAELDALPSNRQIAVRTNNRKTAFLQTKLADTLTVAEAYGPSDKARIGFFNDCFLASANDAGTFSSNTERDMWKAETQYLCMGGESCYLSEDTDTYCKCSNAYKDLKEYHWTYLGNHSYIANKWKEQGCFNDASARVGYRFVLNGAAFDGTFAAGQEWKMKICFDNYGYASLINERKVEFVVRNVDDPSEEYVFVSNVDPRIWKGGHTYVYEESLSLPSGITPGKEYGIYISMPDVAPTLHGRPSYSVRFANVGTWDEETGYNLLTTVTAE